MAARGAPGFGDLGLGLALAARNHGTGRLNETA
jgi:hypothetical protein